MTLYFITGNQQKFLEAKKIIPELEQLSIDLDEIQELDPKKVIEHKLQQARKVRDSEFIVEDTSLVCDGLNGLPGTFVKWFWPTIGQKGLFDMVKDKDRSATARTMIGYSSGDKLKFFEGLLEGELVAFREGRVFGFDPIFLPKGHDQTLSQMSIEEKNAISMRAAAFRKLKEFLES